MTQNKQIENRCSLEIINPTDLFPAQQYGFSHICRVQNINQIIHISGQGGENSKGKYSEKFAVQIDQVFINLEKAFNSVQVSFENIAMLRVLIVNFDAEKHELLINKLNTIWSNQQFPACTLIPTPCLAIPAMLIEIEATAYCAFTPEHITHV